MAKPVDYHIGARLDFDESFDWYHKRSVGTAIGFASAVDEAIDQIVADPGRFPVAYGRCRFCALQRYPFRVVFREEPDRLVVVAIAHAKRSPRYWHGRIAFD